MPSKKRHGRSGAAKQRPRPSATSKSASKPAPARPRESRPRTQPLIATVPRAQRTRRLLLRAGFVAVVAIPVVAILVSTISDRRESSRVNAALEAADCAVDSRADDDAGPGRNHREGVVYEVDPPAGGDHSPSPMPPGRYTAEQAPDPRLVHSMEHGYVIVWHQPDLDEEQLSAIDSVYREYGRDTLVVERPSLDVPVAATAWHKRALCDTVEADALSAFVERYRNKGPEQVAH